VAQMEVQRRVQLSAELVTAIREVCGGESIDLVM
jgi:hypothetical protein